MPITIASIMNLMGPDMMVILLIVLLLFGAKKLPELARGMGKAVKEFSSARDEIERELTQSTSAKTPKHKWRPGDCAVSAALTMFLEGFQPAASLQKKSVIAQMTRKPRKKR